MKSVFEAPRTTLVGALALVISPVFGQTPIKLENFSERLSKDVPVSGRVLIGAAILPEKATLTSRLRWAPSGSKADSVCVSYAVRNGVYAAQGRVPTQVFASQKGPWLIEADHQQEARVILGALQPVDLAVLARQGPCDQSLATKGEPILLLDRRETTASGGTVALLINPLPGRSVSVDVEFKGKLLATKCLQLGDEHRNKAYSTQCEFGLPAEAGEVRVRIERRRFEQIHESTHNLVWGSL